MPHTPTDNLSRCPWCLSRDEAYMHYHDHEWGRPSHDDRHLFEHLVLEAAQAGLSWYEVLRRRAAYRRAFAEFDAEAVAAMSPAETESLLLSTSSGIIRNRAKVESTVHNAKLFLDVQAKHGTFDNYIWGFVDGNPVLNNWTSQGQIPAETDLSRRVSKEMKRLGFKFVGPVGMYAYLQSVGIVNDHIQSCHFRE